MTIWAIIPVKPLIHGKSRLSSVLNEKERLSLNIRLLKRTLKIITRVPEIQKALIVTNDQEVVEITKSFGFEVCLEEIECGMNRALDKGMEILRVQNAASAIILPSDLPFITAREVQVMIKMGMESRSMVIVPDRKKVGTNAIFYFSLKKVDFRFGPFSFESHLKSAQKNGIQVCVFESDKLGLDLDLPEDLKIYQNRIATEAVN
jgi:2-phospho-L-lactate guanylyltransferase